MDPLYSRQVTALMHCLRTVSKLCIAGIGLQCMGSITNLYEKSSRPHHKEFNHQSSPDGFRDLL